MSRWRAAQAPSTAIITAEGHRRLKDELDELWRVRRPEVVRALADAAAEGDRSENAEYIYRKRQLRQIDSRIRFLMKRMIVKTVGHMKNYGLPEPEHHPADAHPSVSGEFLTRAGCGDVHMKPNIAEKMGKQVKFTDGSVEDVDAIIYATGYNITFPFLDHETAPVVDNHIGLFKRIWRPGVPNLFFMGLAQPLPSRSRLA